MTIHWNSIVQGAATGVVGSLVFAGLVLSRDKLRSVILKRRIQRQIRGVGCGTGINGLTAEVHNHTGKNFTVREVTLITDKTEFPFNATGKEQSSLKLKEPRLTREQKKRLARGEMIEISSQLQFQVRRRPPEGGFVTVTPFTSQEFLLPVNFLTFFSGVVKGLRITVEYESWTHETRILQGYTNGKDLPHLRMTIEHYRNEHLSGSMNAARRKFGMPEIPMPSTATQPPSTSEPPLKPQAPTASGPHAASVSPQESEPPSERGQPPTEPV
jgi:hypothetical protein